MEEFNPAATSYDPRNALWLGKAAALAYQDASSVQEGLPGLRVRVVGNPATDTEGFVAGNDAFIVVAFRGTQAEKLKEEG